MKKIFLLLFSIVMLLSLFPSTAMALGVAIGPSALEIPNALRGGEYERTVTVFNPSETETQYTLRTDEVAGSWVSFHDMNTNQVIQNLTIAGSKSTTILVKIKIPSDSANGSYSANIYAETVPVDGGSGTGASTILQAKSVLSIAVTGTQIIDGTVFSIETRDTEAGLPVRFKVDFKNTGNVAVKPQINCTILKGTETVTQFSYNQTEVKADKQEIIPVEWATSTNQQIGEYSAQVSVTLADKLLMAKQFNFNLLSPGTLTRQGELSSLTYDGQSKTGTVIKIIGVFNNTGQGDALTKLVAEVYFNGNLIETTMSDEALAPVGENSTLTAYYKLMQKGTYTIAGHVTYDGKQTDVLELTIITAKSGGISTGTGAMVASLVLLGTIGSIIVVRKVRKKSR